MLLGSKTDWSLTFSPKAAYTQEIRKPWLDWKQAVDVSTHPLRLLVREDTRGPSGCEIAVDFEGVPRAPLVGIDPVFTWFQRQGGRFMRMALQTAAETTATFQSGC